MSLNEVFVLHGGMFYVCFVYEIHVLYLVLHPDKNARANNLHRLICSNRVICSVFLFRLHCETVLI